MSRIFKWLRLSCLILVSIAGPVSGQELIEAPKINPASVVTMRNLLFDLWQPGMVNREQVEKLFDLSQTVSRELTLAYVANRLNDNRTADARKALESATISDSKFVDGWLLKSHLDIVGKDYGPSLMALRSAKRALDEPNAAPAARTSFYRRAGELIGYMSGPVAQRVDQQLVQTTVENLLKATSDDDRKAFEAAIAQIQNQYQEIVDAAQVRLDDDWQKQANVDATLQVTLTNQNQSLMQTEQSLRSRLQQLQADLGQLESQLTSQLSPLQSTINNLGSQIRSLQWTLSFLYQDLAQAQNTQLVHPFTIRSIVDQIQRVELNLFSLQSSLQSAVSEYNAVQAQLQATRSNYQNQINETQRELKRVGGTVTRNQSQLVRLAAGPAVAPGKREAEDSRVTSLSRYIKLSPDLMRQQLLELLDSM
jgi:hypothetical protein